MFGFEESILMSFPELQSGCIGGVRGGRGGKTAGEEEEKETHL